MNKKCFSLLAIVTAIIIFSPNIINADLGPKPSVNIDVVYNQQAVPGLSFNARMLGCVSQEELRFIQNDTKLIPQLKISEYDLSKNCYWAPVLYAWGGECSNSKCEFGYMPPNDFKLAVYVSSIDRVFITNEISRTNFNSHYKAELFSDGSAKITDTTPVLQKDQIMPFIISFIITIILELLVSLIFIARTKISKKILIYVLLANIITVPIVWFAFPLLRLSVMATMIPSEIFAVVFEILFVYFAGRRIISFKQSIFLNLWNNLISWFIGTFILRTLVEPLLWYLQRLG